MLSPLLASRIKTMRVWRLIAFSQRLKDGSLLYTPSAFLDLFLDSYKLFLYLDFPINYDNKMNRGLGVLRRKRRKAAAGCVLTQAM